MGPSPHPPWHLGREDPDGSGATWVMAQRSQGRSPGPSEVSSERLARGAGVLDSVLLGPLGREERAQLSLNKKRERGTVQTELEVGRGTAGSGLALSCLPAHRFSLLRWGVCGPTPSTHWQSLQLHTRPPAHPLWVLAFLDQESDGQASRVLDQQPAATNPQAARATLRGKGATRRFLITEDVGHHPGAPFQP